MPDIPIGFYSALVVITAFVAALILFLRIKKNHILATKSFFWHYALGFIFFGLAHIPIFIINLGIPVNYNFFVLLYIISFFAVFIAQQLFFRGTNLLFVKEKVFTTLFPIIVLPFFAALAFFLLLYSQTGPILIYTVLVWSFIMPISVYLSFIFLYSFVKGTPFGSAKKQLYALLLSLGWFIVLITYVTVWFQSVRYAPEFWAFGVISSKGWYL